MVVLLKGTRMRVLTVAAVALGVVVIVEGRPEAPVPNYMSNYYDSNPVYPPSIFAYSHKDRPSSSNSDYSPSPTPYESLYTVPSPVNEHSPHSSHGSRNDDEDSYGAPPSSYRHESPPPPRHRNKGHHHSSHRATGMAEMLTIEYELVCTKCGLINKF
jgi:hypothetical protein